LESSNPPEPAGNRRNLPIMLAASALALLLLGSLYLAIHRIYQVDEAQNVYMGRITAMGLGNQYYTNGSLFLLFPLALTAKFYTSSVDILNASRVVFLGIFWLNLLLMALCAGQKPWSRMFLFTLLGAATLTPLWDYGFEVRHDNLMLTLLLLGWWLLRQQAKGQYWIYTMLGFFAGLSQFIAFKSFLYWIPLSILVLFFPPPSFKVARWRLTLLWLVGLLVAILVARVSYGVSDTWSTYVNGLHTAIDHSENPGRFSPWGTLERLLTQMPFLLGSTFGIIFTQALAIRHQGRAALNWDGPLPEVLLLAGVFGILLVNPVPYAYNLLFLVPFMFLAAMRWLPILAERIQAAPVLGQLVLGVVLTTHLLPFGVQTLRHFDMSNARQKKLVETAEFLTDAESDRVYDAAGLIPTRASIGYQWFLHSLVLTRFRDGRLPSVEKMMAQHPPAVILPSYRTEWLAETDVAFIQNHYLTFADDFLVLGRVFPPGGGTYQCLHPGRYIATVIKGQDKNVDFKLDGKPLEPGKGFMLPPGPHAIEVSPGIQVAISWLGPRAEQIPRIGPGDHLRTFVNWY